MDKQKLYALSSRMNGVQSSPTVRLNAMAQEMIKQGKDVVNLTAGETDFDTPENISEAAIGAIRKGVTKYTAPHGMPELRAATAAWLQREWGVQYAAKQITVTCGVKQGLYNLLFATVSAGDEVLIPAPYWVSYPEMVRLAGGIPVIIPTDPEDDFQLYAKDVKKYLTNKTRLLILNTPSNPTGTVYAVKELEGIARLLEGTNTLVASDEIYGSLIFDSAKVKSFASLSEDAYARTIVFNGLSKSHAMTGWRVGFAAGDEKIIEAMGILQAQSATNITSFVQVAAIEALKQTREEFEPRRKDLEERRDLCVKLLSQAKECKISVPRGAFYCFPDVSAYYELRSEKGKKISGSDSMAEYLLEDAGVAVVPGRPFGEDRCIRVSFSRDRKTLEKGITRIVSALQKLSP